MKLKSSILACAVACLFASMATALQTAPAGRGSEVQGYDEILSTLPNRTSIPVRLPRFIPNYADPDHPVFAIVESAGSDGYSVQLAWDKNCNGGNWCHLGELTGSRVQTHTSRNRDDLRLTGSIRGLYIPASIGAYCSDAKLDWEEGAYHYSIAMKCGKRKTLVEMARSSLGEPQR